MKAATNQKAGLAEKFESFCNIVLKVIGIGLFGFLVYYALRYTCDIKPWENEIPVDYKDSELWNLLSALLATGFVCLLNLLGKKLSSRAKSITIYTVLTVSVLLVFLEGFLWLNGADRTPQADQLFVYAGAQYFNEGDFSMLGKGCYFGNYPTNLGVAFWVSLLYKLAGPFNYYACGVVNIFFIAGTVLLGFFISRLIVDEFSVQITYCLSMVLCMPFICYAHFVYGDVPSIFFSFASIFIVLKYIKTSKKRLLFELPVATTLAAMLKGNSAIVAAAIVIVAIVEVFKNRRVGLVVSASCALLGALIILDVVQFGYEKKSGITIDSAFPLICWFALSVEDYPGRGPGWDNGLPDICASLGFDVDKIDEYFSDEIKERIAYMKANPRYALEYYKRKTLSQWNEPVFESLWFGARYFAEPSSQFVKNVTTESGYDYAMKFADRLQMIVYTGMLLYSLFVVGKKSELYKHVFLISIVGGFLFSQIWEVKARYILPYYVMMFPLFTSGYESLVNAFLTWRKKKNGLQ